MAVTTAVTGLLSAYSIAYPQRRDAIATVCLTALLETDDGSLKLESTGRLDLKAARNQCCALLEKERVRAGYLKSRKTSECNMSQIASAYIVSLELLARLERLALEERHGAFWQVLDTSEAKPEYSYSGSVLAILHAFLEEEGVSLPMNLQDARAKKVFGSDFGLILCAGKADAASAVAKFDALNPSEQELRLYYGAFLEQEWEEAGIAMQAGLTFLRSMFVQLQTEGDWLLVFVG